MHVVQSFSSTYPEMNFVLSGSVLYDASGYMLITNGELSGGFLYELTPMASSAVAHMLLEDFKGSLELFLR